MNNHKIEKVLRNFNLISGIDIALIDSKLHTVCSFKGNTDNFCSAIHKCSKCLERCKNSDKKYTKLCQEKGEPIVYTCPFGIKNAVFPIIQNQNVNAFILCSFYLDEQVNSKEMIIKNAINFSKALNQNSLKKVVENLAVFNEQTTDAYLGIISAISTHVAEFGSFDEQPSSIGELIKKFINNNLAKKITLTDLSYSLHYSKATLTQHFKKEFGITIVEYLTKKRIDLSKKLLLETEKPLREISILCGFDDTEYFSKTFKKINSLPPATWREKNK